MKTFLFWFFLFTLILIHAIDMELTTHYIGDQWEKETFPLMKMSICYLGVYNSIWISRAIMYTFFYICYLYRTNDRLIFLMFLTNVLYYLAMIDWLFNLNIIEWPL